MSSGRHRSPASLGEDRLLRPGEVGRLLRVAPATVAEWAATGRIGHVRTPSGRQCRVPLGVVVEILAGAIGPDGELPALLLAGEVAELLDVAPRTVATWAQQGRLPAVRLPSGHRRYPASAVSAARARQWRRP